VQRVAEIQAKAFTNADMWWPKDDMEFAYESPEHWARESCLCPDDVPEIVEFETGYRGGNCFALIRPLPDYGQFDVTVYADEASAIEARQGQDAQRLDAKHESAAAKPDAPKVQP
jgi:hypothetical protein